MPIKNSTSLNSQPRKTIVYTALIITITNHGVSDTQLVYIMSPHDISASSTQSAFNCFSRSVLPSRTWTTPTLTTGHTDPSTTRPRPSPPRREGTCRTTTTRNFCDPTRIYLFYGPTIHRRHFSFIKALRYFCVCLKHFVSSIMSCAFITYYLISFRWNVLGFWCTYSFSRLKLL